MTIQETRNQAAKNLGIGGRAFDGSKAHYRELSQADQIELTDEMARIIAEAEEDEFTDEQRAIAAARLSSPSFGTGVETYTFSDQVSDFFGEAGTQAQAMGQRAAMELPNLLRLAALGVGIVGAFYVAQRFRRK